MTFKFLVDNKSSKPTQCNYSKTTIIITVLLRLHDVNAVFTFTVGKSKAKYIF